MKKALLIMFVSSVCISLSAIAYGSEKSTTLPVNVEVVVACTVSATSIAFPDYDGSENVDTTGQITVNCPSGTPYHIALNAGLHPDGTSVRRMAKEPSGGFLYYRLYKDINRTTEWGDSDWAGTYTSGSSDSGTGTGSPFDHDVYGRIGAGSTPPVGTYNDTVTVTVHY